MVARCNYSNFRYYQAIISTTYSNIDVINGLDIDTLGCKSLTFDVEIGGVNNPFFRIEMEHADEVSKYTKVPKNDILISNTDLQVVYEGGKRYVRLMIEPCNKMDTVDNSYYISGVAILEQLPDWSL